jgi:hypothetical protein
MCRGEEARLNFFKPYIVNELKEKDESNKNYIHYGSSYYCSAVLELPTPAYVKKPQFSYLCLLLKATRHSGHLCTEKEHIWTFRIFNRKVNR